MAPVKNTGSTNPTRGGSRPVQGSSSRVSKATYKKKPKAKKASRKFDPPMDEDAGYLSSGPSSGEDGSLSEEDGERKNESGGEQIQPKQEPEVKEEDDAPASLHDTPQMASDIQEEIDEEEASASEHYDADVEDEGDYHDANAYRHTYGPRPPAAHQGIPPAAPPQGHGGIVSLVHDMWMVHQLQENLNAAEMRMESAIRDYANQGDPLAQWYVEDQRRRMNHYYNEFFGGNMF